MKHLSAIVLLLALASALSGATWIGARVEQPQIRLLSDRGGTVTFEMLPGGFESGRSLIAGKEYATFEMPAAGPCLRKGCPELPVLAQSVIIPDQGGAEIKLVSIETSRMKCPPPVPSKGNLYRDTDPATVPYSFGPAYGSDAVYPASPVRLSPPFILRDFRAATVQLFPLQYDFASGELIIIRRAVVEIVSNRTAGANELRRGSNTVSREFQPLYRNLFLNYGTQAAKYDTLSETGLKILIITADAYRTNLQPLVDWKRRKGYDVKVVNVSAVGNNATSIKSYIQSEYDANHPSYVLLVGEATEVAPGVGTAATASGATSDPIYSLLAGADDYPDIFIGRFSAGSAAHVDVQVAKSIMYERTPQIGGTWYGKAVGIASNEGDPCDSTRVNWLRDTLLAYGYTSVDKVYQGTAGGTAAAITAAVNGGRGLINYVGHGSQTSWASVTYSVSDVHGLTNDNLLPVVNSVACVVGDFAGTGECFAEAWQWAGTPSAPRGSVVHYGSSINQSWVPPCLSQRESANLIAKGIRVTAGGFFFNGSCRMMEICADSSDPAVDMFQSWHIFGDPSVPIRSGVPVQLSANHPATVAIGSAMPLSVNVTRQSGGAAVAGALVCALVKGDSSRQTTGLTDASGNVTLAVTTTALDTVFITVTGYNLAPYEGTVAAIAASGPYVTMLKHGMSDAEGNNDGVANPGETVRLPVWVINYGVAGASGVTATLRTSSGNGTVTADSVYAFGSLAAGDSAQYAAGFGVTVNAGDSNGVTIPLTLECRDENDSTWTSSLAVTVGTAVLGYNGKTVGGNGRLDPGEATTLALSLKNNGMGYGYNTQAVLRCSDVRVTVTDSTAGYGTVNPGGVGTSGADSFGLSIGSMPAGTAVGFTVVMKADGVADRQYSWNETVGDIRYSPTPDNTAGAPLYYAVEDSDGVGRAPVYSWAEIRGIGTQVPQLNGDDSTRSITLPFGFKWYGTSYTTLSACSNGWISFGSNSSTAYSNTAVPTTTFATPTVFALWDDLNGTASSAPNCWIGYYNDAANHRFIVEYDSIVFYSATSTRLKFEVIYTDSTVTNPYYDVVVQYALAPVGTSSSIGFQKDGTTGSQLLYNGTYATTMLPLGAGRAVRITRHAEPLGVAGPVVEPAGGVPQAYRLGQAYPNPARGRATISYQLPRGERVDLAVYNIAGQKVRTLASGSKAAGYYTASWDGRDESGKQVSSGVYLVRLVTPSYARTGKLSMVR